MRLGFQRGLAYYWYWLLAAVAGNSWCEQSSFLPAKFLNPVWSNIFTSLCPLVGPCLAVPRRGLSKKSSNVARQVTDNTQTGGAIGLHAHGNAARHGTDNLDVKESGQQQPYNNPSAATGPR